VVRYIFPLLGILYQEKSGNPDWPRDCRAKVRLPRTSDDPTLRLR
jgi:hypothetical protein